jgi:hypothetical protein
MTATVNGAFAFLAIILQPHHFEMALAGMEIALAIASFLTCSPSDSPAVARTPSWRHPM